MTTVLVFAGGFAVILLEFFAVIGGCLVAYRAAEKCLRRRRLRAERQAQPPQDCPGCPQDGEPLGDGDARVIAALELDLRQGSVARVPRRPRRRT